jgi:hypothetical protein
VLCVSTAHAGSLLEGKQPTRAFGVKNPSRAADGLAVFDGDGWRTTRTSVLESGQSLLEWDLGAPTDIRGAIVQGDNNDRYHLWTSLDGTEFTPAWTAEPSSEPGMRTRSNAFVAANGRYVRLTASGGDNKFSISELALFSDPAEMSGYAPPKLRGEDPDEASDNGWSHVLWAGLLLILLSARAAPDWLKWALAGLFTIAVLNAVSVTWGVWPVGDRQVPFVRAVAAGLALAAVLRGRWPGQGGWSMQPGSQRFILTSCAAIALFAFGNVGRAQFYDVGQGRPTFLHHYDMRVYFPIAKYFSELRFDGVYAASAAAYADDATGGQLEPLGGTSFRDLHSHETTTVATSAEFIRQVKARFTPQRWAEFQQDMRYFREGMGPGGYLGSMMDHGGNATPVWFLSARGLFGLMRASDTALWAGVALDVLLLVLAFASIAWAFGWRTAVVSAVVFGAMDFYMFGTNWFGATLRHDWLSLWAIGIACLKKERYRLAGAALVWAAMIRAFPAVTFVTLLAPLIGTVVGLYWKDRRWPSAAQWREWLGPLPCVAQGAAVWGGLLFVKTLIFFGPGAWLEWLHKVSLLNRDGHVNNLAMKTWLITDTAPWLLAAVLWTGWVMWAAARCDWARAAAWGVALVPVWFNPANYYLHCVFLLCVLADELRREEDAVDLRSTLVWSALTLMCVVSFSTTFLTDTGTHFRVETYVLFGTLGALGVISLWERQYSDWLKARWDAMRLGSTEAS